ncbi:MAG: class I SAM-dependent methyltransferase [Bacteroidetes bacterium]|nr:class I SAM-dependent methyltransferase [Bacteroidota bacterium]
MDTNSCPLCNSSSQPIAEYQNRQYLHCPECKGVFLNKQNHLSFENEFFRYNEHNNDVNDVRYQDFVKPIVNEILKDFKSCDKGLDFGAGPGPVISKLLTDEGYQIAQYDPFFHNNESLLKQKYNYIVCCEVIEHFYNPNKEFKLLNSLMKNGGKLYLKTTLFSNDIDFRNWHYKNDNTHVFFYQKETFDYIKNQFGFSELKIEGSLIVFSA